eukprot:TRINITY_DN1330_c0_g2_i3.p1 TRINITY_DN1330_c0_g2~~TRINITY_DN1330_c0_g2_i3.p1  ORF type:complete len:1842 (+),score=151.67 TRINITY_DN1330_c0_g2_i3:632-6157(+)
MVEVGVRATVTQLFVMCDMDLRGKAIHAIRNFLVDDEYCLEFYDAGGLDATVTLLASDDVRVVEMALTSIALLVEVLEGVSLELVDTYSALNKVASLMRQKDEDAIQEICLHLVSQLFASGEVNLSVCPSDIVSMATQRLSWLGPGVQQRAIALLALLSENPIARDAIKSCQQWASMTLTLAAAGADSSQQSALKLLANMTKDEHCCRILREKTNSIKILTALAQSLQDDALELCKAVVGTLSSLDFSDSLQDRRVSFREARPSSSIFALRAGDSLEPFSADTPHSHVLVDVNLPVEADSRPPSDILVPQLPRIGPEQLPASPKEEVLSTVAPGDSVSRADPVLLPVSSERALSTHLSFTPIGDRDNIVQELLLTETAYVATVNAVLNVFVIPLRQSAINAVPVLTASETSSLFSNVDVLCSLHGQFYGKLRDRISATWSSTESCIGDIFNLFTARFLEAYTTYVSNFGEAMSLLGNGALWKRVEWILFFRSASQSLPDLNLTGLGHFLVQPFHRLHRYALLLNRLIDHTHADHPDAPTLRRALEKVREISDQLHHISTKISEPMRKLLSVDLSVTGLSHSLVDTSRRFVQEVAALLLPVGHTVCESPSRGTSVHLLLFTDLLVVAKAKKHDSNQGPAPVNHDTAPSWCYRAIFSLPLPEITHAYVPDEDPEECKITLDWGQSAASARAADLSPLGPLTFIFRDAAERDDWLNSISRLRNASMARVMKARQDSQAALASNDLVVLSGANQILRNPPFLVKYKQANVLRWRDSYVDTLSSNAVPRMIGIGLPQASEGRQGSPTPVSPAGTGRRTKSIGMTALNSVSSVILKARRATSSKKVSKLPLPAIQGRLENGAALELCQLLPPMPASSPASLPTQLDLFAISTYRQAGDYLISLAEAPVSVCVSNNSKILAQCFRHPYVLTLHEDMRIQVYNLDTQEKQFVFALGDVSEASSSSPLSPTSSTLICDSNRAVVVLTMGEVYRIHLFRFSPPAVLNSPAALVHEASLTLFMPMDTLSRAVYAFVPVTKFSVLRGDRMLLACRDQWQVWSLTTHELVHFETNNIGGTVVSFADVRWHGDVVVATTSSEVHAWTVEHRQLLFSIRTGFLVSSIFLDDFGILIGGHGGQVMARPIVGESRSIFLAEDRGNQITITGPKAKSAAEVNDLCHFQWRNAGFIVSVSPSGIRLWHLESAKLVKHWKSRGHVAVSCSLASECVRLLVRRRAVDVPAEPDGPSYEIWQINLKFLDKWLSEHVETLGPATALPSSGSQAADLRSNNKGSAVIPHEDSNHQSRSIHQLHLAIPATVGLERFPWMRTVLLPIGALATMYKGVGSIFFSSESSSSVVENAAPIVAWAKKGVLFMTLHKDGTLQVVDSGKVSIVTTFQARPLVALRDSIAAAPGLEKDGIVGANEALDAIPAPSYPFEDSLMERTVTPSLEPERETLLLADADTMDIAILRCYDTRYVVWQLQFLSSTIITSVRKTALVPPSTPLLQLEPRICSYWGGYLLLGSRLELQLWNVGTGSLVKRLHSPVSAASVGALQTFSSVATVGPWAFAAIGDSVHAILLPHAGVGEVSVASFSVGVPITEMLAFEDTLIVGTSDGMIFSFPLRRANEPVSLPDLLVRATEISFSRSTLQHPSFAVRKQDGMQRKVNCLARQGRFVFAGHEGNCISVWSYNSSLMPPSHPVFVKEYMCKNPVLRLEMTPTSVFALTRGNTSIAEVGLLLLVLNITTLMTTADIPSLPQPQQSIPAHVVTFTANSSADDRFRFDTVDAGLADISTRLTSLRGAARQIRQLHTSSSNPDHSHHSPVVSAILTQLEEVQCVLRELLDCNEPRATPPQ